MSNFFRPAKRMLTIFALLIILVTPCLASSALLLYTLKQIASKKSITLSYQDDAFPSSWQNGNIPVGCPIDICNSVVSVLKAKPRLKNLKVEWVGANPTLQFVLIKSHMADIMCTPTFYSKSCHNISEFSLPFYSSSIRLVARKNENNDNLVELSGHSVLIKSSTICVEQLQEVNAANDLDISIQLNTNNTTAFNELKNGEYSVLISSTIPLKGMIAQTPNPGDYKFSDIALSVPLSAGLSLPSHDEEFREFVDGTLSSLMASSGFTALYNKWFQSPIPPKATSLNTPISDNLKALTSAKKKVGSDYEKYN